MSKRMSGPELNNLSDEKRKVVNKSLGQHPSGVKAPVDSADVSARLKSCPDTKQDLLAVEAESAVPMTLAQVRAELKGVKGKRYWQSMDELADTAEFQAAVEREFPSCGAGVGGSGFAARLHEVDGRVDGAGRAGRMHQAAR